VNGRLAGASLVAAAALFWVSWLLMPGVGVTDTQRIFELVGARRSAVLASVVLQLASAALYAPALVGVAARPALGSRSAVRVGAGLLLVGAMGSAADAVLHLLAYAMTAPGLDRAALAPAMEFMQGRGLALLAPLLLAFFAGSGWLSVAFARAGAVSRWNPRLLLLAGLVALGGAALAARGVVSGRAVGLVALGLVSAAQGWLGIAIRRDAL
jgi:hypothetical protein